MTGNIQSMKWMLIAWQSSAWKTWNVPYAWSGWALQRRGEIKVWLQYIFLFLHVCVQKKGNEPFQWIRCINTTAVILSRFKNVFLFRCSMLFFSMDHYPWDNSKGHLEGSLEMGWPGAALRELLSFPFAGSRIFFVQRAPRCQVTAPSSVAALGWAGSRGTPLLPVSHVPGHNSWSREQPPAFTATVFNVCLLERVAV